MRSYLVISLVLVYCIDQSQVYCETFVNFMKNLPVEIGKAFGQSWDFVKAAIKQPYRIKRLGHIGPRKKIHSLKPRHTMPFHTEQPAFRTLVISFQFPVDPITTSTASTKLRISLLFPPKIMDSNPEAEDNEAAEPEFIPYEEYYSPEEESLFA